MHYRSGTVMQTVSQWHHMCSAGSRWMLLGGCRDVMATVLKVWHHIENPTPSVDGNLLYEQSGRVLAQSDLKW